MVDRAAPDGVGVLVFDQVEVLDFAGPFEVFSVTRRREADRESTPSPCPPVLIAPGPGPVLATGGLRLLPDYALEDCPPLRALILPGGRGVRSLLKDGPFIACLKALATRTEVVMSVCTGAGLLAAAGLLSGRRATTHHRYLDWLAELAPDCRVVADERVVDEGGIITAGGISAGIDAALHLVARWEGAKVAEATATYMEYRPTAS